MAPPAWRTSRRICRHVRQRISLATCAHWHKQELEHSIVTAGVEDWMAARSGTEPALHVRWLQRQAGGCAGHSPLHISDPPPDGLSSRLPLPRPLCRAPMVHRGFHRAWTANGFRDRIMRCLQKHLLGNDPGSGPRKPVQVLVTGCGAAGGCGIVPRSPLAAPLTPLAPLAALSCLAWPRPTLLLMCRHSLGGALATLCAYDLAQQFSGGALRSARSPSLAASPTASNASPTPLPLRLPTANQVLHLWLPPGRQPRLCAAV